MARVMANTMTMATRCQDMMSLALTLMSIVDNFLWNDKGIFQYVDEDVYMEEDDVDDDEKEKEEQVISLYSSSAGRCESARCLAIVDCYTDYCGTTTFTETPFKQHIILGPELCIRAAMLVSILLYR